MSLVPMAIHLYTSLPSYHQTMGNRKHWNRKLEIKTMHYKSNEMINKDEVKQRDY